MMDVRPLEGRPEEIAALSEMLVEAVAHGAGVSFMHPLEPERAETYWHAAFEDAREGGRIILGGFEDGEMVGTITVHFATAENQPHRAEIWKMIVSERDRRRGVGSALLEAAEEVARANGKSLLVLETVTQSAASKLYERNGWVKVGEVPDFALLPDGTPWPATFFYKKLGPLAA